ncbi:MAG: hypothetical protein V3W41_15155 [Planctomycetota bacterium]
MTLMRTSLVLCILAAPIFAQLIEPARSSSRESKNLRHLHNQLLQVPMNVKWEGRTLLEALGEVRAVTGINLFVGRGIKDLADEEIDLTLIGVPAYTVMRVLADEFGIGFLQRGRMLVAMTRSEMMRRSFRLRIYDIRAGLYVPPDFPGPRLDLNISGSEPEEREEIESVSSDPEQIIEIIKGATGEANWDIEGASLEIHRGRMIVRHSPGMQRRVLRILAGLGML